MRTPGHMSVRLTSERESIVFVMDAALNAVLSLQHPESYAQFDMDPSHGVATRRRLLDQATSDQSLVHGYHFPWPGVGNVRPSPRVCLCVRACALALVMLDEGARGRSRCPGLRA